MPERIYLKYDAADYVPIMHDAAFRAWLAEELDEQPEEGGARALPAPQRPSDAPRAPMPPHWRERLWECAPDVRLGVRELAEAMDRSPDWVYRATNAKLAAARGRAPLPCARLDGVLVFTAGAVRRWLNASEEIVNPEPPRADVRAHR